VTWSRFWRKFLFILTPTEINIVSLPLLKGKTEAKQTYIVSAFIL
jgi:hypothetical protein